VSDLVLDASLALQWFLVDEADRKYSLSVLSSLSEKQAVVPVLWFYEVGNGLVMAYRRKRIAQDQIAGFLTRLKNLPIEAAPQIPAEVLDLPALAQTHSLTNYDAAYLSLALRLQLPLATTDAALRGWPRLNSERSLWVAHPCGFVSSKGGAAFR
jgi:predicted nucleic acid-binding protein